MTETVFNINESVKVKLTDHGRKILADQNNEFAVLYPKAFPVKTPDDFKADEDENGYTTFQLWSLMERFGKHIGACKPNCFDTNIIIKQQVLEWKSKIEELPELGKAVLVYLDNGFITIAYLKENCVWQLFGDLDIYTKITEYNYVTNWMDLPSPPSK